MYVSVFCLVQSKQNSIKNVLKKYFKINSLLVNYVKHIVTTRGQCFAYDVALKQTQ